MLGYAMVFPLLPIYAVRMDADATVIGLMVASFSMAQVAAAPLWGRISDRFGRRPVLLVTLFGSASAFATKGRGTTRSRCLSNPSRFSMRPMLGTVPVVIKSSRSDEQSPMARAPRSP